MSSSSNESFIPKRGEAKSSRRKQKSQVYLFTIVSYVLIFATLLAAGAVFLYGKYIDAQLEQSIAALNQEVSSFNEADMKQVQDFHGRLSQAEVRLNNSASVVSVLEAIEAATIGTVKFTSFSLKREADSHYLVEAKVETDTFDSSLFQRGVLERSDAVVESIEIENLQLRGDSAASNDDVFAEQAFTQIGFGTEITVPLSAVPYVAPGSEDADAGAEDIDLLTPATSDTQSSSTESLSDNQPTS